MARARISGSAEPAVRVNQASALARGTRTVSSVSSKRAAQQRAVVLMLLALRIVSPQPPSGFCVFRSQSIPPCIKRLSVSTGFMKLFAFECRTYSFNENIAVAVDKALLESSPSQWPCKFRAASRRAVRSLDKLGGLAFTGSGVRGLVGRSRYIRCRACRQSSCRGMNRGWSRGCLGNRGTVPESH